MEKMEASPLRKQHSEMSIEIVGQEIAGAEDDTFVIPPKGASIERLRRWREEEKERIRRKHRAHAQVIRAALLFKKAGEGHAPKKTELPEHLPRVYGIGEEQLMAMTRDHNYSALQEYGGSMHRIGRSEKTKEETYWLSKGNYAKYSYSELQDATNNFKVSLILGKGGFGIVYKGILQNTTVAIKMLKEGSSQGEKEFNQEVEILSKVRHPNLVKLIGACVEVRALIYEYLPNGSLEDRLQCINNTSPLSWQARVRIAFEICSALIFLHGSEPHGIVHGDLKPDNVLLDGNDTSKICDFGLCRQLNWTASASIPYHWTNSPKGTFAYMDPEYFSTGKITPQFDVYSFGIILLRLATCKSPMGIRQLVEEAKKKGTLKTLMDVSAGPWPFKEAKKMISLGLRCSDPVRKKRPDLSTEILKEINSMLLDDSASLSCAASLFNQ